MFAHIFSSLILFFYKFPLLPEFPSFFDILVSFFSSPLLLPLFNFQIVKLSSLSFLFYFSFLSLAYQLFAICKILVFCFTSLSLIFHCSFLSLFSCPPYKFSIFQHFPILNFLSLFSPFSLFSPLFPSIYVNLHFLFPPFPCIAHCFMTVFPLFSL